MFTSDHKNGLGLLSLSLVFSVLTACGGGSSGDGGNTGGANTGNSFTISGTINGSSGDVVLSLNGQMQTFSGSSFSFTSTVAEGSSYSVAYVSSTATQTCSVSGGAGTATADVNSVSVLCNPNPTTSAGVFLCGSHVATQTNVIGNNTYEFIASNGDCFGTTEEHGQTKQDVTVVATQTNVQPETSGLISFSAQAKLTKDNLPAMLGGFHIIYLSMDVTNTSGKDACVEIAGATLQTQANADIVEVEMDVLGDMYYGQLSLAPKFYNICLPPGATRIAWGAETRTTTDLPNGITGLDHIAVSYSVKVPDDRPDDYYLEALTPNEAVWTTETQTFGGEDYHYYTITNDFINMTAKPVVFDFHIVDILYYDDNGYLIFNSLSTIEDFLGISDSALTDANHTLDAMGGTIGVEDHYGPILTSIGSPSINGRASKVIISLDICDGVTSPSLCS